MEAFIPVQSLLGGVLVGLATFMVLFFQARVAGISGILGSLFAPERGDIGWRLSFLVGMVATGAVLSALHPEWFSQSQSSPGVLVVAGLMVGLGTRLANGCTSGHGVCGIARLSARSLAATGVFMLTAVATTYLVRQLLALA